MKILDRLSAHWGCPVLSIDGAGELFQSPPVRVRRMSEMDPSTQHVRPRIMCGCCVSLYGGTHTL